MTKIQSIPSWKVRMIRVDLAGGMTHKEIAELRKVSVVTVGRISTCNFRKGIPSKIQKKDVVIAKCGQCNYVVEIPCLACEIRAQEKLDAFMGLGDYDTLEFDLKGMHKKRHEKLVEMYRGLPDDDCEEDKSVRPMEPIDGPDLSDINPGDDEWFDDL